MAWNHEHAGVAAAPAVAIDWSVTATTEAARRLAAAGAWDLPRLAEAAGEIHTPEGGERVLWTGIERVSLAAVRFAVGVRRDRVPPKRESGGTGSRIAAAASVGEGPED